MLKIQVQLLPDQQSQRAELLHEEKVGKLCGLPFLWNKGTLHFQVPKWYCSVCDRSAIFG